jgi:hypothetical protein
LVRVDVVLEYFFPFHVMSDYLCCLSICVVWVLSTQKRCCKSSASNTDVLVPNKKIVRKLQAEVSQKFRSVIPCTYFEF